jgi:hypothetical protein
VFGIELGQEGGKVGVFAKEGNVVSGDFHVASTVLFRLDFIQRSLKSAQAL